jgi:hypothetical protein
VTSSRFYENSNAFLKENKKFEDTKDTSFVISGLKVTRKSNTRGGLRKWSHQDRIEETVEERVEEPVQTKSNRVVFARSSEVKPVESRRFTKVQRSPKRASTYTNRVFSKSVNVRNKRRFKLDEM